MGREVAEVSLLLLLAAIGLFGQSAVAGETPPGSPLPIAMTGEDNRVRVEVRPGDHLWSISQTRLELVRRSRVSASEVSPYWRAVIAANRASLRSGDPDLIFPGEVITLPATDNG